MNIHEITEQYMLLLENNMNDLTATKKFIREKQKIDQEYSNKIRQLCQIEKKEKKEDKKEENGFELSLTNMMMTSTLQCLTLSENLNENLKEGLHVNLKKYSDVYEQRLKKIRDSTNILMGMVNESEASRVTEKNNYQEEFSRCTQLKSKQRKQEEKAVATSKFKNYLSSTQTLKVLQTEKLEMINARNRYYLASVYHQNLLNQSRIEFFPYYVKQLEVIHDDFIDNRKYFSDNLLESQILHLDEMATVLRKIRDSPSLMDDPSVLVRLFLDIPSKEAVGKVNARYLDIADVKELFKVEEADIYDFGINAFAPTAFLVLENVLSKAQTNHKELSQKLEGFTKPIDIGNKKYVGIKDVENYNLINDNDLEQLAQNSRKFVELSQLFAYEAQKEELDKFFNSKDMKVEKESEWHLFEETTLKKIQECAGCKAKIWGKGLKCKHCRTCVHLKCETKAENNCEEMRKKIAETISDDMTLNRSEEFNSSFQNKSEVSNSNLGKLELFVSEELLSKFAYAKADITLENGISFLLRWRYHCTWTRKYSRNNRHRAFYRKRKNQV
eukprot:NODE_144_length_15804_cov_0.729131.p4 type:complete len:557 gc:universal NODE_144_length_15804_cov_0.729131:8142-9812(+)